MREVVEVPGLTHPAHPIPLAVKMGNLLFTGTINGTDPATGLHPPNPEEEVALAFQNVNRVLAAAGAREGNIASVTVYLRDTDYRRFVNNEWVRMFPDERSRPVRYATVGTDMRAEEHSVLPGQDPSHAIQILFVAVLDG